MDFERTKMKGLLLHTHSAPFLSVTQHTTVTDGDDFCVTISPVSRWSTVPLLDSSSPMCVVCCFSRGKEGRIIWCPPWVVVLSNIHHEHAVRTYGSSIRWTNLTQSFARWKNYLHAGAGLDRVQQGEHGGVPQRAEDGGPLARQDGGHPHHVPPRPRREGVSDEVDGLQDRCQLLPGTAKLLSMWTGVRALPGWAAELSEVGSSA